MTTLADEIRSRGSEIFEIVWDAYMANGTADDAAPIVGELVGKSADQVADKVAEIFGYIENGGPPWAAHDAANDLAGESFAGMRIA